MSSSASVFDFPGTFGTSVGSGLDTGGAYSTGLATDSVMTVRGWTVCPPAGS